MSRSRASVADELDAVSARIERLAALVNGGVSLRDAWGYIDVSEAQARESASDAWRMCVASIRVAEVAGAPLARVLRTLAESLRQRAGHERALVAALAGPVATARLVVVLPLLGIAVSFALGLDPLGSLLGTPIGIAAGLAGVALLVLARWWTSRILARASRGQPTAGLELELVGIALAGSLGADRARALANEALAEGDLAAVDESSVADTLALAANAGVPAGALLQSEARAARLRETHRAEERAARAGVALSLPLGACILPAFVLLGVVPVVLTIARQALSGVQL